MRLLKEFQVYSLFSLELVMSIKKGFFKGLVFIKKGALWPG
ncbi:hypothetical protein X474_17505 [Dethiosulfatarculus sandiegensis]|uniref:Uncharacterized protein n=1 Tax=Dethiosulfatarculus sandiegensis TaxID=1429043 RepID=A0A0D2GD21_9BACT|nr:hypothetical protein X474_17505 [Dethiosulfatarculus sandiegensis]